MSDPQAARDRRDAAQVLPVYRAAACTVLAGVNHGEALSFADDLVLDDVYELARDARLEALSLRPEGLGFRVADGSGLGRPGRDCVVDCAATFMGRDGGQIEALVLVEVADGHAAEIYLVPLSPMRPRQPYTLVGIDRD
ncbi:MAG: Hint domain-containing protein, partial [Shimia sp.]